MGQLVCWVVSPRPLWPSGSESGSVCSEGLIVAVARFVSRNSSLVLPDNHVTVQTHRHRGLLSERETLKGEGERCLKASGGSNCAKPLNCLK